MPTVHHLRHFAVSNAHAQGLSLVEIAEMVGHRSDNMTAPYSHTFSDTRREKVSALGGLLGERMAGEDAANA